MAGRRIIVVVKVVIPHQLFTGCNVADGENPNPILNLIDFTIGIAGMIQVGAHAFTVDDRFAVIQAVEVSAAGAIVQAVGFLGSQARTGILDDPSSLADARCGEDTGCMDS